MHHKYLVIWTKIEFYRLCYLTTVISGMHGSECNRVFTELSPPQIWYVSGGGVENFFSTTSSGPLIKIFWENVLMRLLTGQIFFI